MRKVFIKSFLTLVDRRRDTEEDVFERREVTTQAEFVSAVEQMWVVEGSRLFLSYYDETGVPFQVTGFGMGPYENAKKYLEEGS